MRSGKTGDPPFEVTRTGRIDWMFAPGFRRNARKPKCSWTYAAMIDCTSGGMTKLWFWSQVFKACGSVAVSWTVSYGPTTSCFVTVTPPPEPSEAAPADGALEERAPPQFWGAAGQFRGGAWIVVVLMASSAPKSASELSPTVTSAVMGSTHANSAGLPR
jgi:hypothetical protein